MDLRITPEADGWRKRGEGGRRSDRI